MNERDKETADDWMREHIPGPDEYSLEDDKEEGNTQKYFFLRYRDSATVVYKVAVRDGKVSSVVNRFPDNAIRRPFPLRPRHQRPDPPLAEVQVAEEERLLHLGPVPDGVDLEALYGEGLRLSTEGARNFSNSQGSISFRAQTASDRIPSSLSSRRRRSAGTAGRPILTSALKL